MENNSQQEQQQQTQLSQMLDAYNDEYWMKKYGVSTEELKAKPDMNLPAKIIAVTIQHDALVR